MDREAIEEAIEVLEDASAEMLTETGNENYYGEAITALRKALVDADDTSQKHVDEMVKTEHDKQIEIAQAYERGWNAALAQQEPVAWITDGGKGELWWHRSSKFDEEGNLIGSNQDDIPLYTAPPKKEWVGLTDEEKEKLVEAFYGTDIQRLEAVEAKLKEKNT
jgi:hypothetical protein